MAMHGGNLVLLQQNYGLTVNDAQTLAPIARFEADLPKSLEQRSFEAVAMSGDTAWLAAWGYGLIGVDLTDPAAPVETGKDRKSTRLNSSHSSAPRMPSS